MSHGTLINSFLRKFYVNYFPIFALYTLQKFDNNFLTFKNFLNIYDVVDSMPYAHVLISPSNYFNSRLKLENFLNFPDQFDAIIST